MRCTSPVAIRDPKKPSWMGPTMDVPCGRCRACRNEKARQWAIRITQEASLYEKNCFVTLTYNDFFVPITSNLTLVPQDLTKFFKRLRKHLKFRYFAVGEYGDKYTRPHYHILFFGIDFRDLSGVITDGNYETMEQTYLRPAWSVKIKNPETNKTETHELGITDVGGLSWASASYCAKYVTKKLNGKAANVYKEMQIEPEYAVMSRNPGIGSDYFERYIKNAPSDYLAVNGKRCSLPRYYREKKFDTEEKKADYKSRHQKFIDEEEARIKKKAVKHNMHYTAYRKMEYETIDVNLKAKEQFNQKKRTLDNEN